MKIIVHVVIIVLLSIIVLVNLPSVMGLHKAIENFDNKKVESILKFPVINFEKRSGSPILNLFAETRGDTPMEIACRVGNVDAARMLLDAGASTETKLGDFSLLYITLQDTDQNDLEMVKLLVEHGADPLGSPNDYEECSLVKAALMECTDYDPPNGEFDEEAFVASSYSQGKAELITDIFKYLYQKVGDKDYPRYNGETALMQAALRQNKALISYILEEGIDDVNAEDDNGQNCVFYVLPDETKYDHEWKKETLDLLRKWGADFDVIDKDGKTARDYAEEDDDEYLAELISYSNSDD